jgi:hypothetical protein
LNLKRVLFLAAALGAIAAAASVCVVALSFAVYALADIWLSPAGAAAVVAATFALLAVVVAGLATRKAVPKSALSAKSTDATPVDRIVGLAKDRPLVAVAAAAVVGVVLFRNPAVVGAIVSALVGGAPNKPRK